jgi:arginyl-tRNA synthetase
MLKELETIIEVIKDELLAAIRKQNDLINDFEVDVNKIKIQVELTKNISLGDFSTNVMLSLGLTPDNVMKFAECIANELPKQIFSKVTVSKPGFINMFLSMKYNNKFLDSILKQKDNYGKFPSKKEFYNIEFVSANPTGLLHIGHARNAAIGDSLARI